MEVPDIKGLISIGTTRIDPRKGQPGAAEKTAAEQPDSVQLSSEAATASRELEAQQARTRAAALARTELLARLKAEYESGQMNIDSQAIAEKMMAEGIFDEFNGTKP
jgi:anti-sigma28 factor (negative regulator of flagellin synthesis)